MPKIFEQNQKINVIEYGANARDMSLKEFCSHVIGTIKSFAR